MCVCVCWVRMRGRGEKEEVIAKADVDDVCACWWNGRKLMNMVKELHVGMGKKDEDRKLRGR